VGMIWIIDYHPQAWEDHLNYSLDWKMIDYHPQAWEDHLNYSFDCRMIFYTPMTVSKP
jgi:hypothetical protein